MGKRRGEETSDERSERKRQKKEEKKKKKDRKKDRGRDSSSSGSSTNVFSLKKLELSFSLLPAALNDVKKNVEESMRLLLLKYTDVIDGILLAFENVQMMSKSSKQSAGMILNELPYVHYRASTDALVFSPKPGCNLKGVITESFHSHVSLVVHHYFNASVSAEQMKTAGFQFDDTNIHWWYWKDSAKALSNGSSLDFICQKLYESGGHISIEGKMPSLPLKAEA